ncbi:transposase [Prevotella sp. HCN-7019]|uniref:transposase n=1 Tax=Prevotella sp. HCN-7019 TaxID=3134668 RepID=UPI004040915E
MSFLKNTYIFLFKIGKNLSLGAFTYSRQLIIYLKNNMYGALTSVSGKLLLRKRSVIEAVHDELKI